MFFFFAPGTEKELGIGLVSYQAEVHHRAVRGGYFAPRLFKLFNCFYFFYLAEN